MLAILCISVLLLFPSLQLSCAVGVKKGALSTYFTSRKQRLASGTFLTWSSGTFPLILISATLRARAASLALRGLLLALTLLLLLGEDDDTVLLPWPLPAPPLLVSASLSAADVTPWPPMRGAAVSSRSARGQACSPGERWAKQVTALHRGHATRTSSMARQAP